MEDIRKNRKMKYKLLITLILVFSASCKSNRQEKDLLKDLISVKIQKINSLELDAGNEDMTILNSIVKDASIVCLGESRHDLREQFKLKNRLVKHLIEELGFRTFALEASFPYAYRLNDYLNAGAGDLNQIMSEMPGWFLWDTQEMLELFIWLKEFNSQTDDKVKFYGFDIVAPNDALDQIFNYLERVGDEYSNSIQDLDFGREFINDNHWPTTLEQFTTISEERKSMIKKNVDQLYQTLEKEEGNFTNNSSEQEFQWILKLAYSVKEAIHMFLTNDRIQMGLIRDEAMANLCSWIIGREGKTIIWAHNVHIANAEFTMSMFPGQKIKGMGAWLAEEFNDKLISIGGTFGKGEFRHEGRNFQPPNEATIDGLMAQLDLDNLIVDLRGAANQPGLNKWLNSENSMRGQEFEMFCVPIDAFDALFYTNNVSKVQYNRTTIERMRN